MERSSADRPPDTGRPKEAQAGGQPVPPAQSPDPHQRIDGLRAWLAQVERRLGIRTYALAAAGALALAAGIVALVLVLQTQEDSATDEDVQALREQLDDVERAASQAAEEDVQSLADRIDEVEGRVSSLEEDQRTREQELTVIEDDINDLRDQVSELESAPGAGAGGTP